MNVIEKIEILISTRRQLGNEVSEILIDPLTYQNLNEDVMALANEVDATVKVTNYKGLKVTVLDGHGEALIVK